MTKEETLLLVVDLQEKLLPAMVDSETVLNRCERMIQAMHVFKCPIVVTEQYPKGLGRTVECIQRVLDCSQVYYEKTQFNAMTDAVTNAIAASACKHVILMGVELHVCVYQTARSLIHSGYSVSVVSDAVSSRNLKDMSVAEQALRTLGVQFISSEMIIYDLLEDASAPEFKEILKIVK